MENRFQLPVFPEAVLPATSYSWTNDTPSIGLGGNGTGDIPSFTATNTTNAPITATIEVIPTANECEGISQTFTITVNPTPDIIAPENMEACNGEIVSAVSFTGNVSGTTYSWSNDHPEIGLAATGTGNLSSFTASNTTDSPIIATITITPAANNCEGTKQSFTITVNPTPTVDAGEDQTICSNGDAGISATLGGGITAGTWSSSGTGSFDNAASTSAIYTPSANDTFSGTVTLSFTSEDPEGPCGSTSDSMILTINKEVLITTEPLNAAVCTANSTEINIEASGDNLTYQWYKGTEPGTAIAGGTAATLKINNATAADAGIYYVVVSGENSCTPVKSEEVSLNVDENIIVNTQPTSQDLCEDGTLNLSVAATATGGDVQYQWRKDGSPLSDSGNISGTNTGNLSITNLTASDAGDYDVLIDGPDGYTCDLGYSQTASITVNAAPTADAGADFTACSTNSAISLKGEDASASNYSSLKWTTSNGNGTISNANSLDATYAADVSDYDQEIEFTLTAIFEINGNQPCSAAVATKKISIIPLPVITTFTYIAEEFCETDTEIKSPGIVGEYDFAGGTFSVEPSSGLNLNADTGAITPDESTPGDYVITYTAPSNATCTEAVSQTFNLTIGEKPVADFSYEGSPFCSNSENISPVFAPDAIAGTFTADSPDLVFTDNTTGEINMAASKPGTYTVTNTIAAAGGCIEVTAPAKLTITPLPVADFTYENSPYCSNSENPIVSLAEGAQAGNFTSTDGLVFADATTGEIDLANTTPGTYTVTNTIDAASGCEKVTATTEITITKLPVADFTYEGVTADNGICISTLSTSITTMPDTGGSYSSDNLEAHLDASTGEITWQLSDDITGEHTITYTIPAANGCGEVSHSETIHIDPLPEGGFLSFGSTGRIFMICQNPEPGYADPLALSDEVGNIVAWQYRTSSASSWSILKDGNENFTGNKLSADQIEALKISESTVFRVQISSGACLGDVYSETAIITVIPSNIEPAPVQVTPRVVCKGEEVTLSSSTGYGEEFGKFDGGAFQNAGIKNHGWRFTNLDGGSNDFDSAADNGEPDHWLRTQPKWKFITANLTSPYTASGQWWNSSADPNDKSEHFAITQGNNSSRMETPVFSLGGLDQAILTFDQAFNLTPGATIQVEISDDGGNSYTTLYEVISEGESNGASGNRDHFSNGTPGLNQMSIDLGDYIGYSNLRIRFSFIGVRRGDVWAVDNIEVPEGPRDISLEWRDYSDPENFPDGEYIGDNNSEQWTPKLIGWNTFEVKTKIVLDSNGNTCSSIENSKTIRVFVFDQYTTTSTAESGTCGSYEATLHAEAEGAFGGTVENYPTADGYQGKWVVQLNGSEADPTTYELTNLDSNSDLEPVNDPDAVFTTENSGNYTFTWTLVSH